MNIFDGHSHIGTDTFYPLKGDLNSFIKLFSKLGVSRVNLMSVPCPTYDANNIQKRSLIWDFSNKKFNYYSQLLFQGNWIKQIENPQNPYYEINNILKKQILEINSKIKMNWIPLVHPVLDTPEYLEKIMFLERPVAIKIHGLACGITPQQVSNDTLEIISKSKIPVIVHTDYISNIDTPFNYLRRKNSAKEWLNIFEKYQIKGYITHGAALCSESLKIIEESKCHVLALGPDLLISSEPENLMQKGDYLDILLENLSLDKIVFDIDYPYNINDFKKYNFDLNPAERILKKEISKEDLDKIMYSNSLRFFDIKGENK